MTLKHFLLSPKHFCRLSLFSCLFINLCNPLSLSGNQQATSSPDSVTQPRAKMAPDLNSLFNYSTDGYKTDGVARDARYEIPDVVLNSPTSRKIRVLSIGAGVTGIMNAYYIQKLAENVEHVIYEKNEDIGGYAYSLLLTPGSI